MNDSILFNIVREENSLCYSISSYISRYNPALTIYAGINKSNYEKTLTLIKECVELMKDRKTLERLFDSAKKTINTYLNNLLYNPLGIEEEYDQIMGRGKYERLMVKMDTIFTEYVRTRVFTDEMKNVTAEMNDAIPTNFDVNGSYNGLNSSSGINTLPNYNFFF